jgi:adenylyltransferase/sulfurtransferase
MPGAGSSPTCDTAGVIMPIIASVTAVQVTEAIKLLVGKREGLHGSLMQIDIWASDWRKIKLEKPQPDCPACGKHNFEFLDAEQQEFAAVLCGRNAVQVAPSKSVRLDLAELSNKLSPLGEVKMNEFLLRFAIDSKEITIFPDGRAIVKGTDDVAEARSVYARFIGT